MSRALRSLGWTLRGYIGESHTHTHTPPTSHTHLPPPHSKPGHSALIKNMSAEMDKGVYEFSQEEISDVHTVTSLFKKFFKELPDPMIPEAAHDSFIECARMGDEEQRLTRLAELVRDLPMAHYHTLKYLMQHLKRVAGQSELNKVGGLSAS